MSEKENVTFHDENAVFRIAMWSNIVAWIALVIALVQITNGLMELIPQWEQFLMSVPELHKRALILVQYIAAEPVTGGIFAFLVLRAVSQGLYLLMDFYMEDEDDDFYEMDEDFDDDDDDVEETQEA